MGDQQPLEFKTWAREYRGMRGQLANTAENRRLMLDLQRGYSDYRKQFEPATVQQATLPDGSQVAVVNGQLVRDTQPRVQYDTDKAGNLLAIQGTLANYVTNSTGERIKAPGKKAEVSMMDIMQMTPEQKQTYYDRLARGEDPAAAMPTPSPTPDPGMTNSMAFQGVPSRGNYETNMPTGVAAPVLSSAMGAGPGISMTPVARATAVTNAPAPAAVGSPAEIRAAYQRGAISKDDAIRLLRGGS